MESSPTADPSAQLCELRRANSQPSSIKKIRRNDEELIEAYEFMRGLRATKPYKKQFKTFVKRRWVGKQILDILVKEFSAFDRNYFERAIAEERIRLNGYPVDRCTVLKDNQLLEHDAFISEPPVLDLPTVYLGGHLPNGQQMIPGILFFEKPCGIPVHPGAAYHRNSLLHIIQSKSRLACKLCCTGKEHDWCPLASSNLSLIRPLHRIDRLTSGIVMFGTSEKIARELERQFRGKQTLKKIYLARVSGDFRTCIGMEYCDSLFPQIFSEGMVECVDRKTAKYRFVQPKAHTATELTADAQPNSNEGSQKEVSSNFCFVSYCAVDHESVICCWPITGRTHQLRTQLQTLQYPICNDPCYGPPVLRHAEYIPWVPHVDNLCDPAELQQESQSSSASFDQTSHPSGIFLHAFALWIDDVKIEASFPTWACTCSPLDDQETNFVRPTFCELSRNTGAVSDVGDYCVHSTTSANACASCHQRVTKAINEVNDRLTLPNSQN